MEFRDAVQDDFKTICTLVTSEQELFMVHPTGSWPLTVEQLNQLAEVRQDLTVGTDRLQVVGFANLLNLIPGKRAFIGNLVVDKAFRGQTMGKKMVNHMLELIFHQHDLPEAHISVFRHNTPAIKLYSGFGFLPYETTEWKDFGGNPVDLLHMKLDRTEYRAPDFPV